MLDNKKLSFCTIVKDNIANVKRMIDSVIDIVDEIVIIDTGSPNDVKEYCRTVADVYIDRKWQNNFAKMRNLAISKATNSWILTLDSDEEISSELQVLIPTLIKEVDVEGYFFHRIHYVDEPINFEDYWMHLRLYKNNARYFGAVHESIKNLAKTKKIHQKDCIILHHNDRKHQRAKSSEYIKDLELQLLKKYPKDRSYMHEYYEYKLWVQENIYHKETDVEIEPKDLNDLYEEYEKKKAYINRKIKEENWDISKS